MKLSPSPMLFRRTKIVATIGPASRSREVIQQMLAAGMNVARLNFSHGDYKDHAETIALLRQVANEAATPLTLLQDLQGPKIRVGQLPEGSIELVEGEQVHLVPLTEEETQGIGIDYPYLAEEAQPGMQVLLDDGLLELVVEAIAGDRVTCRVVQGGTLKSRKGVNLPDLNLRLPSLTDKDKQDIQFGIEQGVDIISLSFVRRAEDLWELREYLAAHGASDMPVLAKIEKPQAVENLSAILGVADAIMVARGDLGVEMRVEKVPLLQKQIIRECNYRSIPVITATQMLESMIHNPRPTRAEASDVANAILDGTDAVMLSGESAVGAFPVQAVKMLARIAADVEPHLEFDNMPAYRNDETHALGEALTTITQILDLRAIACFTETGYTATIASGERVKPMIVAFTDRPRVYHWMNLLWGVKPILLETLPMTFEGMIAVAENQLKERQMVTEGDKILILGGIPAQTPQGTNFIKIHTISA
ncbi:pyruvate kinase [Thermosynechococcus sp. QKsg1]|uniref:pyruvate kinase n=1 Tax=unclassified Thermosynechococcus TaxID=2622553 RepID=UPI00122E729B|nr:MULTISPECIES: pyruvate kinase [unclassified Thermosynechococcus]QEQ01565.1 pyruvate kinase [Thermosynechococcus sp. CL-1]WJI23427.1 pyruvate kinase [Thermosynechococcus sp. B0]WJI28469.1 pyruvate kinase [Thermosynechococcus sp. B3]WNC86059.1 pyruvate kinase [Thermosynechococcus sp. QKsg1]